MIQTVFKGAARSVFLSLLFADIKSYDEVKIAVLKAYEFTPEYYRLKFRSMKKSEAQIYIECVYTLCKVFGRWLNATEIESYHELTELMLLEQFKSILPICPGANQSILLKGAYPEVEGSYTGEYELLKGVGGVITAPLCRVFVKSQIGSQWITVAVQDTLPVEGISIFL